MKMTSHDEPAGASSTPNPQPTLSARAATVPPTEEELLRQYTPELKVRARRLSHGNAYLRDDLFQEGAIGLVHAARRFDRARGVKFSTLARRHIKGRMLNYLRSESGHRRCAAIQECCYMADDHDENNQPQEDCLPITATEAIDQTALLLFHVDLRLLQQQLQATTERLTPRQRQIFAMRYSDGLLPSEIAEALTISPARVSQALGETIAKLQRIFARA